MCVCVCARVCLQAKRIDVRHRPDTSAPGAPLQEALPYYKTEDEWLLDTEGVNLMEVRAACSCACVRLKAAALQLLLLLFSAWAGESPPKKVPAPSLQRTYGSLTYALSLKKTV